MRKRSTNSSTTLAETERRAIVRALRQARGNRSQAARALGIDRSTLRRKLSVHGIVAEATKPE